MNARTSPFVRMFVLVLFVIGILALALGGYLTPLTRISLNPLIRAQTWLATRYTAVTDYLTMPRDVATLRQHNQELESEVAQLQSQIIELQQQNSEIQLLSALLDFARTNPAYDYVAANVIGFDPSPFLHYVFINRGSDHGLQRDMPVVTAGGLVGRVAAVTAGAARVQLNSDPDNVVNVLLQSSNTDAVLQGSLIGEISLDMIPQGIDIQPGELILTSGLGGSYPPNILIGQVTSVRSRTFDLFQTASVQPVVDFSNLKTVLVIRNFRPLDISPLIPDES